MVAEAKALGAVPYKSGTLTNDYFLKTQLILSKYVHLFIKDSLEADIAMRRGYVAAGNEEEFQKLLQAIISC